MSGSKSRGQVVLLHSPQHTNLIQATMEHIHKDRDILLASLLYCCGFLKETPKFFQVIPPKIATRSHIEAFHAKDYLDLLEYCPTSRNTTILNNDHDEAQQSTHDLHNLNHKAMDKESGSAYENLLDAYGLTDDCFVPTNTEDRKRLWKYICSIAGASLHGANLLLQNNSCTKSNVNVDVVINWSGGRHHAQKDQAAGFCYVNDVVLAIQKLIQSPNNPKRVLYLDIDIHHADGVQAAFYDTDQVLTISLHRHAPGFFPSKTGSTNEKGKHGSPGVGYNLNLPLPRGCRDFDLLDVTNQILDKIIPEFDPDVVVLCVGADGLKGDDLVKDTLEGWNLSPEGLAECVRRIVSVCGGIDYRSGNPLDSTAPARKRQLMILGGGGYNPVNTARAFLLCTAAACESSRPGMLWNELPDDVPRHEYLDRYGPSFELKQRTKRASFDDFAKCQRSRSDEYGRTLIESKRALELTHLFLSNKRKSQLSRETKFDFSSDFSEDNDLWGMQSVTIPSTKSASTSSFGSQNKARRPSRRRKKVI